MCWYFKCCIKSNFKSLQVFIKYFLLKKILIVENNSALSPSRIRCIQLRTDLSAAINTFYGTVKWLQEQSNFKLIFFYN